VWNTFLLTLTPAFTASTFTPDRAITMTRIQTQLEIGPTGCTVNAVLKVSDGTISGTHTLTITNALNDSGTISVNYSAGAPITMSVSTAPTGCRIIPSLANVLVQYKAD
jgi:hypothetical protein